MRRWLAVRFLTAAYRAWPPIALAIRNAIIAQLAAEHQAQQQAEQQAAIQRLAAHRERAARAARNN